MKHHLRWRIALPYVVLILIILAGLTVYVSNTVRNTRVEDMEQGYAEEVHAFATLIDNEIADGDMQALSVSVDEWAELFSVRVTVIGMDGAVLAESDYEPSEMENHLSRPEVIDAIELGEGSSSRFSPTLQENMLYLAAPVVHQGVTLAIARVAVSLEQVELEVTRLRSTIFLATLVAMAAALLVAVLVADRVTVPVSKLDRAAHRMAEGDLSSRYYGSSRDEVGRLGETFNLMASRLQIEVARLSTEQGRLSAILNHMADGVISISNEGRVRRLNAAGERILAITEKEAMGRSFARVLRHHELIELVQRGMETEAEQEAIVSSALHGFYLRAIYTPLGDDDIESGFVILQDLTMVRSAEQVRRDFVSNASHELRTPLASLKALVETLRDGALEDPPAAQHFLDMIEDQVDSLTQMVRELLELSRIESSQVPLDPAKTTAADIIVPPVERLMPQAERAGISLRIVLSDDLPEAEVDSQRLHQVITNLVHNAIKFTEPGGHITVSAQVVASELVISVQDTGVGIAEEDLPRIFERFYKADRSRTGGGTGLGLAICKHIVQQHGGHIWVESIMGIGSTFSFAVPLRHDPNQATAMA